MEALEQLTVTGQLSFRVVPSVFKRPLAWTLLAAFAGPAAAAYALTHFAHPLLSPIMLPAVRALGGEAALHYPGMLARLPVLLERLGRVTDWLTLTILLGWAGTLVAYRPRGMSAASAGMATLLRLPRLLLAGAPIVVLHTLAAMMSAAALADLSHRLISAVAHLMAAFALEAAVLAAGMLVLPVLVRAGLSLAEEWDALQRAIQWAGAAALGFGVGMATAAVLCRIVFWRASQYIVTRYPDGMLWVVLGAAAVTAVGVVAFGAASVQLAAALDEGWE